MGIGYLKKTHPKAKNTGPTIKKSIICLSFKTEFRHHLQEVGPALPVLGWTALFCYHLCFHLAESLFLLSLIGLHPHWTGNINCLFDSLVLSTQSSSTVSIQQMFGEQVHVLPEILRHLIALNSLGKGPLSSQLWFLPPWPLSPSCLFPSAATLDKPADPARPAFQAALDGFPLFIIKPPCLLSCSQSGGCSLLGEERESDKRIQIIGG